MAAVKTYADSKQAVKVFCSAYPNKALGITGSNLAFVENNCQDLTQEWWKVESGNPNIKGFVLLSKDTGKAIYQPTTVGQEVVLVDYVAGSFDQLSLWNYSEMGKEFGCICVANNTTLLLDANLSIKVVLQTSTTTLSQQWKITPQLATVCCKAFPDKALGVENDKPKFVCAKSTDTYQQWVKFWATDNTAFALVNKATWMALQNPFAAGQEPLLVAYNNTLDPNLLWSESSDQGEGYVAIQIANNTNLSLEAKQSGQEINIVVQGSTKLKTSQLMKFTVCT